MSLPLPCRCGASKGYVDFLETANRGLCNCRDDGRYRQTPFFSTDDETTIVQPEILGPGRLEELRSPARP